PVRRHPRVADRSDAREAHDVHDGRRPSERHAAHATPDPDPLLDPDAARPHHPVRAHRGDARLHVRVRPAPDQPARPDVEVGRRRRSLPAGTSRPHRRRLNRTPSVSSVFEHATGGSMKYVYAFEEGSKEQKFLLGGKGANLAEMTNLGLPVPPGFTITTDACKAYMAGGDRLPDGLMGEVETALRALEDKMGKRLGDDVDPLLVSVRSGAPFSMPGMMDTVLNLGLNDVSVGGLAKQTSNERFALDSYRRFVQMFGRIVLDIDGDVFEHALTKLRQERGAASDTDLDADDLRGLVDTFKGIVRDKTGEDFPQDPRVQLRHAIEAVFRSWNGKRAQDYRRMENIPDDLGTAVNV